MQESLIKYLSGTGWDEELEMYLNSKEFEDVLETLKGYVTEGKRWVPGLGKMFRWLKETPYNKIKTVLFINDYCSTLNHQGIPFSQDMSKMKKLEIAQSYRGKYNGKGCDVRLCQRMDIRELLEPMIVQNEFFNYDLVRWCQQGVLMFPYSLTSRIDGKPHDQLWSDFRARIIELINIRYKAIPWVLVGKKCSAYEDMVESRNTLPMTEFKFDKNWSSWVNEALIGQKQEPIKWT